MLQRLLLITLTLCSLTASAQWQQTGAKVRYVNGLGIPTKDTAAGVAADSSQILIRPADSSLYIKYKRTWVKVGSGGGGGGVGGSGTTNYVPKFTAGTTIGNSQIFDNGTNVGIGTTSTLGQLDVFSGIYKRFYVNYPTDSSTQVTFPNAFIRQNSRTEELRISQQFGSGFVTVYTDSPNTEKVRITDIGNVGIGYNPAAKLAVAGTTLINTNTDNGVDKLQVSGSMSVSAKATAQNLSVTNNISVTNDINQGSGTANANWTILANGTSSGWAGRMVGEYATGQFYFQHRNNSPTFTTCFSVNANGGKGGTNFYDNAWIVGDGWLTVNGSTNNGVDKLQVVGSTVSTQYKLSALNTAPATASSTGTLGEIRIDANYIYICTATNTWKRVAIATW
jgi:hypothetical protein